MYIEPIRNLSKKFNVSYKQTSYYWLDDCHSITKKEKFSFLLSFNLYLDQGKSSFFLLFVVFDCS